MQRTNGRYNPNDWPIGHADDPDDGPDDPVFCKDSSVCNGKELGFCNFDGDVTGFCEYCRNVNDPCWEEGFISKRGERECNITCIGKN